MAGNTINVGLKANKKRAGGWKVGVHGVQSDADRNFRNMIKAQHVTIFLGVPHLHEGVVQEEYVMLQASVEIHRQLPALVGNHDSVGIVPSVIFSDVGEAGATNEEDKGKQIEDQAKVVDVGLAVDADIARAGLINTLSRGTNHVHTCVNQILRPVVLGPLLIEVFIVVEHQAKHLIDFELDELDIG